MHASQQRGLSLVELMVGLALGLFVVAAGLTLLAAQWREQRSSTAGDAPDAGPAQRHRRRHARPAPCRPLGRRGGRAVRPGRPRRRRQPLCRASRRPRRLRTRPRFAYSRDSGREPRCSTRNEQFGLRLRNGVIELLLGAGNWQALTDAGTLIVTEFERPAARAGRALLEHCARPCPPARTLRRRGSQLRSLAVAHHRPRRRPTRRVQRRLQPSPRCATTPCSAPARPEPDERRCHDPSRTASAARRGDARRDAAAARRHAARAAGRQPQPAARAAPVGQPGASRRVAFEAAEAGPRVGRARC